ncbi:hypothetical protein [Chromobacterium vaccinii]|uniref:hypothetical protein n=1 Tax=Chromobacterium vaccinii TaxID=1108595 RepID=UPI000E149C5B|nr:hypothetical protein [Chromobacterium vaccinii]SUX30179.1 Uncharacterised protein [Chromobacterium vaccinii]
MLNLYNRSAQHLAEQYLMAMKRLESSIASIATAEGLARDLTDAGIPTEAAWQLGAGCLLRVQCAIEVVGSATKQIELVLAEAGFGMVTSGQPNNWVLIDIRENAVQHTLTLIIEGSDHVCSHQQPA